MNFTCPYCDRDQIVQGRQRHTEMIKLLVQNNTEGDIGVKISATVCANPDCGMTAIDGELHHLTVNPAGVFSRRRLDSWNLRPDKNSKAKTLPNYIPAPLIEDYEEACRIRDLSPKAAATLIRRCIQGMIRDFCGIRKNTLAKEIESLSDLVKAGGAPKGVSEESVDAMDHVRGIGNIGAHMEKDIDLIIPVDPGEVQVLIELTESLFDEWYIARHKRDARFAEVRRIMDEKKAIQKGELPDPQPPIALGAIPPTAPED